MNESSTRAFPNGLIPSPLARHVKIFTHWISGGGVVVGGDNGDVGDDTGGFGGNGGNVGDNGGDAIITRWVIWLIGVDEHEAVIG